MRVTIKDIAKLANVSKSTVSAVLNENPLISQGTRERVLEVIQRLNYKPNELARSLATRRSKSIGLVVKEIDNPYFAKIINGVYDVGNKEGYSVLLGSSELNLARELESIETLKTRHADGLIVSPLQDEEVDFTYLFQLKQENYPLVLLGGVKNIRTNVVDIDNIKAASEAISYLVGIGHRDIACFVGPSYSAHSKERREGYEKALAEHGISVRPDYIVESGSYIQNGYSSGTRVFGEDGLEPTPTAVFCFNDLTAVGLCKALRDLGIRVPQDVSVLGFDDIELSSYIDPPLSTVHVPVYEMGKAAAELLLRQIGSKSEGLNETVTLETSLNIRATTSLISS